MSTLIIEGIIGEKIYAIKDFRALTGWGLKESKDVIDLEDWALAYNHRTRDAQ